jgi:glycine cleavage system H protein
MNIPENLRYTSEHEWLLLEDGVATVGITAYAAESLGDVVFVQLPEVGDAVTEGTSCGEVESTKSVSELFAPVSGEVTEINTSAVDSPELVNSDPYGDGWLFKVQVGELGDLLDADAYRKLTEQEN